MLEGGCNEQHIVRLRRASALWMDGWMDGWSSGFGWILAGCFDLVASSRLLLRYSAPERTADALFASRYFFSPIASHRTVYLG